MRFTIERIQRLESGMYRFSVFEPRDRGLVKYHAIRWSPSDPDKLLMPVYNIGGKRYQPYLELPDFFEAAIINQLVRQLKEDGEAFRESYVQEKGRI